MALLGTSALSAQVLDRLSIQLEGGNHFDLYTPWKDANLVDVPIMDFASFNSDKDVFAWNVSLGATYATTPLWGVYANYTLGTLSGSNVNQYYISEMSDAALGLKFFASNMNPTAAESPWRVTPFVGAMNTSYKTHLLFLQDNTVQNYLDESAWGVQYGFEFSYRFSQNWSMYYKAQMNNVFSDGLDGWDYGDGSDMYVRNNIGVTYKFVSKKNETENNLSETNIWSESQIAQAPAIQTALDNSQEGLDEAVQELKKEVAKSSEAQAAAAEEMEKLREEAIAELHEKDRLLFEAAHDATVFFEVDKAVLTDDAKKELFRFVQGLENSGWEGAYVVVITGCADESGPEGRNAELRAERAQAVTEYLKSLGLDVEVEVTTAPHSHLDDKVLDRRVELSVKTKN